MKHNFFKTLCLLALPLAMAACGEKNTPNVNGADDNNNGTGSMGSGNGPTEVLPADEQKDYFGKTVTTALGYFKAEDQRHAVEVAEYFAQVFEEEEWDFEAAEEFFENQYGNVFGAPRYVCNLMRMQTTMAANPLYSFSFANDAMVFEANTATHIVKNMGQAKDGKYTVRLIDGSNTYTVQVWGDGKMTNYVVDFHEFDSHESDVIEVLLPEKIHVRLSENDNVLISSDVTIDMVKDNHLNLTANAVVTSLSMNVKEEINATALSMSYDLRNNSNVVFAMEISLPSFPALAKKDNLTWEDWFEIYERDWEKYAKGADKATFTFNIADCVQFHGKATEGGKFYEELSNLMDKEMDNEKYWWGTLADIVNEHAEVGMYFSSDVKQGDIKADLVLMDREYIAMPLVFFADGSSYDLFSYFSDEKVYEGYINQVNDLLRRYERLFKYWDFEFQL